MKKISLALLVTIVGLAAIQLGCMDRQPAPVCPVPTELKSDEFETGSFDGVDMLVMVDNSGSMAEEQAILATGFFTLVNSLANPIPGWQYEPVNSMRLAVVTSDMGVSYGEDQEIPDDSITPASLSAYRNKGDNGEFQTGMPASVEVQSGAIQCDENAAQCPSDWTCESINDEGVGVCESDDTAVPCPSLGASWASTTPESPNANFNAQAACLAQQGTSGCGFEQQLQSVAVALQKDSQASFLVDTHLLAIILVTDEEDCSMEDAEGLFETEECQDATKLNIACNIDASNEQYLFEPSYFYDVFTEAKEGHGGANAVIFAAIAGVPAGEGDDWGPCQGQGDILDDCLDDGDMEMVPYIDSSSGQDISKFTPACTRTEGGATVTSAVPGRRYVKLATDYFTNNSFIWSICRSDWSPAMENVARLIASQIGGTCYDKALDWDAASKTAKCNVVAGFVGQDECPWELADGDEATTDTGTGASGDVTTIYCPLPKIESELYCDDNDSVPSGLGWFYCINDSNEDNEEACTDGLDNDGDDKTDCDDEQCMACEACPSQNDNPDAEGSCDGACKFNVSITEEAKSLLLGAPVQVQCLQQFSFEDGNCQEDSKEACTNNEDDDGNGIWDCNTVIDGDEPHLADPHCCPMINNNGTCELLNEIGSSNPDFQDICGTSDNPTPNASEVAACAEAAAALECQL